METINHNQEMQETSFTSENARLINASVNDYGSRNSIDSLSSDVIFERQPIYSSNLQYL